MSGGGHRSKVSMLPLDARIRIYSLIQDGATLAALLSDHEVSEALSRTGSTLNGANLTRIRKSREYQTFAKQRREKMEALFCDRMETELIRDTDEVGTIADQSKVLLLKAMRDLANMSGLEDPEERIKALRSLAQSVATLNNDSLRKSLESERERRRQREAEIEELKAEIAALKVENQELKTGRKLAGGLSEETLKAVEEKMKML